jgi:hypothetical protein
MVERGGFVNECLAAMICACGRVGMRLKMATPKHGRSSVDGKSNMIFRLCRREAEDRPGLWLRSLDGYGVSTFFGDDLGLYFLCSISERLGSTDGRGCLVLIRLGFSQQNC